MLVLSALKRSMWRATEGEAMVSWFALLGVVCEWFVGVRLTDAWLKGVGGLKKEVEGLGLGVSLFEGGATLRWSSVSRSGVGLGFRSGVRFGVCEETTGGSRLGIPEEPGSDSLSDSESESVGGGLSRLGWVVPGGDTVCGVCVSCWAGCRDLPEVLCLGVGGLEVDEPGGPSWVGDESCCLGGVVGKI